MIGASANQILDREPRFEHAMSTSCELGAHIYAREKCTWKK